MDVKDTVFSGEDGSVAQHLGQDAADRPDVDGLCVPLGVKHDLWRPVPPRRNVLGQESCVVVLGIRYPCQTKVTDLQTNYKYYRHCLTMFPLEKI